MGCRFARFALSSIFALWTFAALPVAGWAQEAACEPGAVLVRHGNDVSTFYVDLAQDPMTRAQGLMGHDSLASDHGMLFIYPNPQRVSFWMHDTLIPLDILFVDAQGKVVRIAANAKPKDETPIPSGQPVQFVLEINGGLSAKLGIAEGDAIASPEIAQGSALWPCE